MQAKLVIIALFILTIFVSCKDSVVENPANDSSKITTSNTLKPNFERINSSTSNINFNNTITHDLTNKNNLFDYDFFYNGAGVGIEDLNNDGLKDIFFCGNQVENKLYLNKGNFIFEDISSTANINENKFWSNGITFVDINQDGWMDIYVSQGGPNNKDQRGNLLYINQKDLTFKESAKEYGLNDLGISTQAVFFDYDKDGDLDCIVANENDYYGLDPNSFYTILKNKDILKDNSSHLYINDNNKFKDITEQAGLLKPTFGLGLCVSDINNDSWLDIYIANDYYVPDAMYINNKNGSFTDQIKNTTNQVSFYGMGLDIADLNNDNLKDIFVLDMAASDHIRSKTLMASMNVPQFDLLTKTLDLQHQYMFNSVQLNVGNNKFHNIAQLTGMSKTDWSWAALIFDTDLDTQEDIYITNGYRRYALDNDSRMKVANAKRRYGNNNVPLEVKASIYNNLPSEKLSNILYKNKGDLHFEDVTSFSDLNSPSFSNGGVYADLDNDGDLDIVVNNMDDEAFLFKNNAIENKTGNYLKIKTIGNLSEDFAKATIYFNGITKTKESKRVRGYLSSVDNTLHFGLGNANKIDSIKVVWPNGKQIINYNTNANTTLTFNEKSALVASKNKKTASTLFSKTSDKVIFNHKENTFNDFSKEILLPYKQSTQGPFITKGDINNDGLQDLFIGGALGESGQLLIQQPNGTFKKNKVTALDNDKQYEDMEALFIDIDNDSDNDLYVVSGGSEFNARAPQLKDRIYINNGEGNFKKAPASEIDNYTISGKSVTKIDYDKDGDLDLIIGNRIIPQKYPLHEPSIIYENNNGVFSNVTAKVAPQFEDFGMINKVITTDFNNDGWDDFIAVGEWTHIGLFLNDNGIFTDVSKKSGLDTNTGWWFNITETDINKDGLNDYVVGNVGTNIKFKVSNEKPLRIYADDFDSNNTHDVVLSNKYNGTFVPVRGKECSTQQMPFIAQKMPSFEEFANSSLADIYGEKITTAYQREVNSFKSILLLNKGDNNFEKIELPSLAQTMPILDSDIIDVNKDGYEDIVIVGNIYNTEVETPRLDNPYALILVSDTQKNYKVLSPNKTGLYIDGNAKSVATIKSNDTYQIIITCNNDSIETFILK